MIKHLILTVITLSICQLPAQADHVRVAENNKSYPSWYWQLIGGRCCVVEVMIRSRNLKAFQITTEVMQTASRKLVSSTASIYDEFDVDIISERYSPAYYLAQNTSVRNAKIQNKYLKVYDRNDQLSTYDKNELKIGNKIIVLLEPCWELGISALKISHIFTAADMKLACDLIQKMPKFNDSKEGIFIDR